jgi:hypothetical protein
VDFVPTTSGNGLDRPAGGKNRRMDMTYTPVALVIGEQIEQQ